jgi:hypothetical protein
MKNLHKYVALQRMPCSARAMHQDDGHETLRQGREQFFFIGTVLILFLVIV